MTNNGNTQTLLFDDAVPTDYAERVYPARRIMLSSDSQDWCKPPEVLEPIREFGDIGFDPFSNPWSLVAAAQSVQPPQDSLAIDWPLDCLTFSNTPYGAALAACAAHIARQAARGCEMLTLVPARTDTAWWRALAPRIWCAWEGRITFLETVEALQARYAERVAKAEKAGQHPPKPPRFEMVSKQLARGETATFASALCYHGTRVERFARVFGSYGRIYFDWRLPPLRVPVAQSIGRGSSR